MSKPKPKTAPSFENEMTAAVQEINAILSKRNMIMRPVLNFPNRARVPMMAKILMRLLDRLGGRPDLQFLRLPK